MMSSLIRQLKGLYYLHLIVERFVLVHQEALIEESIYEPFMKRVIERVKAIKLGNPLDTENTMGSSKLF